MLTFVLVWLCVLTVVEIISGLRILMGNSSDDAKTVVAIASFLVFIGDFCSIGFVIALLCR